MRFTLALSATLLAVPAFGLDYSDHRAVCKVMMEAEGMGNDTEQLATCSCGFDIMLRDLGAEVAQISARWAIEDKTFPELTDRYTLDEFYALMGSVGPQIEETCNG